MSETDAICALVSGTRDLHKRVSALANDFTAAMGDPMGEDAGYFDPHTNPSESICSYGDTRKRTKPDNWSLWYFSVPYRRQGRKAPKRFPCLTVLLYDERGGHDRAYLKLGVFDYAKAHEEFRSSEGWYLYHPLNIGTVPEGGFQFKRVDGSTCLVRSTPVTTSVGSRYAGLEGVSYFAVPLLAIESSEDLKRVCVEPLRKLWLCAEGGSGQWKPVDGIAPAEGLPEVAE